MATSWESVDVGCPFYRESDGSYIRCEGIIGSAVTINFVDSRRKMAILEQYCNQCWPACPLYNAIADKYE